MSASHVVRDLPLWVEGDLDGREAARVEAHLARCPECAALAESYRQSQSWLKQPNPEPFDGEDRARLRREVMARLRAEAPPRAVGRMRRPVLLFAAAAAALLCLALPRFRSQSAALPTLPPGIPVARALLPAAELPTHKTTPVARKAARKAPAETPSAEHEPARIEFQTDNPSIRIIWLARATPMNDAPSLPGGEP